MNKILLEEIETFRRISSYNPKLTLTENRPGVNVTSATKALGSLDDILNAFNFGKKSGVPSLIKKADDIAGYLAMSDDSFDDAFKKFIKKDYDDALKNAKKADPNITSVPNNLGPRAKDMSKLDTIRKIARESDRLAALKPPQQLSQAKINKIIQDAKTANMSRINTFKPPTPRKPPTPQEVIQGEDVMKKIPWIKKQNWKEMVKTGIKYSIGLGVLYYIYTLTNKTEPPKIDEEDNLKPAPKPGQSRYRNCDNEPKYTQGCRTKPDGPIGQVQSCLGGLVVDGKFWNRTQVALKAAGYPNGFTIDDIPKICNKKPAVEPVVQPVVQPEDENISIEPESSIGI